MGSNMYPGPNTLQHAGGATAAPAKPTDRQPDFSGWATKANLKCADGRTILPDAFAHQDKMQVPLVWHHRGTDDPENILGHAVLENRGAEGVYTHAFFNSTPKGQVSKTLVHEGNIQYLSILANELQQDSRNQVKHGEIREVSLVMAGSNPGAVIDNITLKHAATGELQTLEDEAIVHTGTKIELEHSAPSGEDDGPTVGDVWNGMDDDQKGVADYMVAEALKEQALKHGLDLSKEPVKPDDSTLKHNNGSTDVAKTTTRNVFDQTGGNSTVGKDGNMSHLLTHDAIGQIVKNAEKLGSFKDAAEQFALKHGVENLELLFPDAKAVSEIPELDKRRTEWVAEVINGTKKSPFSRIKSLVADITHDEARARGYIKGRFKKEEWFGLTKRVTTPTTVYKKQKLDRDDVIDITTMDVVQFLKGEMRLMLEEEVARAILIGDGRAIDDEDHIKDPAGTNEGAGIRSILHDHDLYAASVFVERDILEATPEEVAVEILKAQHLYKGSGTPVLFTTLGYLTSLLVAKDGIGRRLWRTASELAAEIGVSKIVTVEVFDQEPDLFGIIVNLQDYTVGSDKGGEVSLFDDFDIDYNQYKYLIETRLSGALTKIRSALVIKIVAATATKVAPDKPAYVEASGLLTVKTTTGVVYKNKGTGTTLTTGSPVTVQPGQTLTVEATPANGYYFVNNVDDQWDFTRPAA